MIVNVKCTFTIPVEVPDNLDAKFEIEDNSCPGTRLVGGALSAHIEKHQAASTCWACALGGKCEIIGPVPQFAPPDEYTDANGARRLDTTVPAWPTPHAK